MSFTFEPADWALPLRVFFMDGAFCIHVLCFGVVFA